jgi:hypothetical protein
MQFQTLLRISASLSISYSPLLLRTRRSNNRLIVNPPSLLTDNSIRTTISSETVEITTVVVAEAEIVVTTEIVTTTVIATRIPTSPTIVIAIRTPRSHTLYIRDQITAPGNIYRRNNKTKRLDLELETSISLRPRIPETLIRSLAAYTYNMWLI